MAESSAPLLAPLMSTQMVASYNSGRRKGRRIGRINMRQGTIVSVIRTFIGTYCTFNRVFNITYLSQHFQHAIFFTLSAHFPRTRRRSPCGIPILLKLGHDDGMQQQRPRCLLSAGFPLNYLMVRVMRHHHWRWQWPRPPLPQHQSRKLVWRRTAVQRERLALTSSLNLRSLSMGVL